jgi:hypothetical protein
LKLTRSLNGKLSPELAEALSCVQLSPRSEIPGAMRFSGSTDIANHFAIKMLGGFESLSGQAENL